jgi:hypothetical protein
MIVSGVRSDDTPHCPVERMRRTLADEKTRLLPIGDVG